MKCFKNVYSSSKAGKYLFVVLFFFVVSILYVKLNSFYLISGVDFDFHLYRSIGLAESIYNGDWFPKINYYMANGLGYGVPMFYGQYYLYIPAMLITTFNLSVFQSWLCLYVVFYFFAMLILFFTAKKSGISDLKAIIFTWLIVFNPLIASIVNGDMPFAICLILLPLLLIYLDKILKNEVSAVIPIAIIATIILNTHILSTIIIAVIALLYVVFNYRKTTRQVLFKIGESIVTTVLLSAFFIFPMIEQISSQKLVATNAKDVFRYDSVKGLGTILNNSLNDSITSISRFPTIGLIGIILLPTLFILKKNKYDYALTGVIVSLIILGSNVFPWLLFDKTPLGSVQFVGRYLVFALILIIFQAICEDRISGRIMVLCLVITFVSSVTKNTLPNMDRYDNKSELANEYRNGTFEQKKLQRITKINETKNTIDTDLVVNGISGGEYLNENSNIENISKFDVSGNGVEILKFERNYNEMIINYETLGSKKGNIVLPAIWYKGYEAEYSNGGKGNQPKMEINKATGEVENEGLVVIDVEGKGRVKVKYKGTIVQTLSVLITLTTLAVLFVNMLFKKIKNGKKFSKGNV